MYVDGIQIHDSRLLWVLCEGCVLKRWSELENLSRHYSRTDRTFHNDMTLTQSVKLMCDVVTEKLEQAAGTDYDESTDGDKSCNLTCIRFWGGVERRTDSVPDLRFTIGGNEDFGFLAKRSRGVNRFG